MVDAAADDGQEEGEATLEQQETALEQPEAVAGPQQAGAPEVQSIPVATANLNSEYGRSTDDRSQQRIPWQQAPAVHL
jgi:hypothetical protein